ncbi:MAG TPA: FkbM family methyltransferase [Cyanobacteria bacterium UBA11049]|nr:FkbM family methyltransferase [Cyanobacteria bacterium UBA11049]
MTVGIVGSRKLEDEDPGSQGWNIFSPHLTIYGFDADVDACNKMNAELESRQVEWREKHIPLALWNAPGKATLYINKDPGSSSLYPPNESYIQRYMINSLHMELVSRVEVEVTTLDSFCQAEKIDEIDFLQLDVQGAELRVLQGASRLLEDSVLAIKVEVEFTRLYKNQPLFSDVDVYLRNQGFTLFDLTNMQRDYRRSSPIFSPAHPGLLIWADAFYFRDLIQGDCSTHLKTPERILKLACIADALNFTDYAVELLEYLTLRYGNDRNYNFADHIIELLLQCPEVVEQGLDSLPIVTRIRNYANRYNV